MYMSIHNYYANWSLMYMYGVRDKCMRGSDLLTNTACGLCMYRGIRHIVDSEYFSLYCFKMYLLLCQH